MPKSFHRLVPAVLLLAVLAGCAKSPRSLVAVAPTSSPVRSALSLTRVSDAAFTATLTVDAPAGARILYALDPGDGAAVRWTEAAGPRIALALARRARPYILLSKTVAGGIESAVERHEFTADNVVARAQIVQPFPTHQQPVPTPLSFTVQWIGTDPEAPGGRPTGYLTRLATAFDINPGNPTGITQQMVDEYFRNDLAAHRDAWRQTTDSSQVVSEVPVSVVGYFAVAALDAGGDPGATETTFDLDRNVLQFRPTSDALGPDLRVMSDRFDFTVHGGRPDPTPRLTVDLKAGATIDVRWFGIPVIGRIVTGYRWALDPAALDDATPRRNDRDLGHWSAWSLVDVGATIGPFPVGDANKEPHQLWIEARDNLGGVTLAVAALRVLPKSRPTAQLLLVDDQYGTPTERNVDGSFNYKAPYPMEAEQDSFYDAVGGFPDEIALRGRPTDPNRSTTSLPGAFAGFDYDTLDYRFWPQAGIDLPTLERYRAVAWYTDNPSAARSGSKFSNTPGTALRLINSVAQLNTLAEYVANGGKVWLFGEGVTTAIGNGFWSRFGAGAAPVPYAASEEPRSVLQPGNFLFDFVHLRSLVAPVGSTASPATQLHGAIPYLPEFAGPASNADRSHDPRIGPSAARTALRWSGLPRLTIPQYRTAPVDPAQRGVLSTWVVTRPLQVTEGRREESVLDTLYLCQARGFDLEQQAIGASDGFPNALDYHGSAHGEVVWFGFSLYWFEREQARQVVRVVMRNFGIAPLPPGVLEGPGTPEPPPVEPVAVAARGR